MIRKIRRKRKKRTFIFNAKTVKETVKKNRGNIVLILVIIGLLVFLGFSLNSFLFASEYFNISEIEVIDQDAEKIDYPLARIKDNPNIFKVDLVEIAKGIEREHADIQKAIVKRILPNKLIIEVLRRRSIAQAAVKISKQENSEYYFYLINNDGYILANMEKRPKKDIPIIIGSELNIDNIQIGHRYETPALKWAISFIEELKKINFTDQYKVTKVDVTQPRSMSFYIKNRLEIRIGNRDWRKKIENLVGIMQNLDIDYSEDYYIDLRFKDFVFGKK
ncbi:MAG: cell division protein FtsQ/DivIB [Candidatus Omnitrophota bacterium]